jgi:RHS repeat-associated protein
MRAKITTFILLAGAFTAMATPVVAQDLPEFEIGLKPYGTYHGGDIDSVSLTNGNLTLHIPLFNHPQRGGKLIHESMILHNGKTWRLHYNCNQYGICTGAWSGPPGGVSIGDEQSVAGGSLTTCTYNPGGYSVLIQAASTGDGATHALGQKSDGTYESIDASGIRYDSSAAVYTDRSGIRFPGSGSTTREDTNGNKMTTDANSVLTDTLGRQFAPSASTNTTGCPAGQRAVTGAWQLTLPGPPASSATTLIKVCNASVPLQTNFQATLPDGSLANEYSGNKTMIQSVVLCNSNPCTGGPTWTFEYDSRDAGDSPSVNYGDLTKISFPFGGSLSYTWESIGGDIQESRAVRSRTLDANDGTGQHTWTYTPVGGPTNGTNVVTDPLANDTAYTVTFVGGGQSGYVTQAQYYQGSHSSGALLKTETTDYTWTNISGVSCGTYSAIYDVVAIRVTTTWPGGKVTKIEKDYDAGFSFKSLYSGSSTYYNGTYGDVVAHREYDYGSGAPGALTRQTINSYLALSNASYKTNNLLDLLSSVVVKDGAGTQKAATTYGYDAATPDSSGITTQHDSNPPTGSYRGNRTSVARWLNTTGTYLTTTNAIYDTGMLHTSTDPGGHMTTYTYSATFAGAYVTSVTDPMNHVTGYNYNFNTGLRTSVSDVNSQTTSYSFDYLWRTQQISYPTGGGTATFSYVDSAPASMTLTRTITSSVNYVKTALLDGVARVKRTQLTSDPDGTTYVDTTYDADGRKGTLSNPYRSTSEQTYGITTFGYDALSRVTSVGSPSGGSVTTSCAGNCTTVTDQQLKPRKSCTDGLGRLAQVFEPDPVSGSLINETDYTYDTLDNLTQVQQKGNDGNSGDWRTRTFTYDSLSRLLTASNPESGTTTYTYNYGNDKLLSSKQDARGTTTTYAAYDADHDLTSKTYSDSTPAVGYSFNGTGCLGQTSCYNIHHRTAMTDGAGSEAWAFDRMGRAVVDQRITNSLTKTFTYGYTNDGTVNSITYPSGHVVTYDITGARRPDWAKDTGSGINYATAATYCPQGALKTATYGGVINRSDTYNNRLQPASLTATGPGGTSLLNLSYTFTDGSGHNNGNVMAITNNRGATRTQTFTYDQLNRIKTAGTSVWTQAFTDDIWGNLYNIVATGGAPGLSLTILTNNRISGDGYDAAGNMTNDGLYNYLYNAENQQSTAAGVNYTYDGDGKRLKKSNGKLYWYGMSSDPLLETDLSGNLLNEYVFFGGNRSARRDSSSAVYYYLSDHLGSSRVITLSSGSLCYDADFYAYGGERVVTNNCPQNYKFTSKERDSETQNDYFGARHHASNLGRFMSADTGPYLWRDPQTLNRYPYTRNNPLRYVDPAGMYFVVAPEMQAQVKQYISTMLRSPQGEAMIRAISASSKPSFFTQGQLDRHQVPGTNQIAVTNGATTPIPGNQPGQVAGTQTTLSNSNIAFTAGTSTGDIFAVGLKAFAHEDAHVVDINAAHTLQQAAAAGASGDAPSQPGAENTTGGTAEERAVQIMGELGDAGQSFQPNAETDAQAGAIIQSGMQQFGQDLQQLINQAVQHHGCTADSEGQHCD